MSRFKVGDLVVITDPVYSSIPADELGALAEIIVTNEYGGRLKMVTGPRPNHKWWFCDPGVKLDANGGPW